jgi:hypothetical protein
VVRQAIGLAFGTSQFDSVLAQITPALLVAIASLWLYTSHRIASQVRYLFSKDDKDQLIMKLGLLRLLVAESHSRLVDDQTPFSTM